MDDVPIHNERRAKAPRRSMCVADGYQTAQVQTHTITATPVAIVALAIAAAGIRYPSIATLVSVANKPPAGVKPPYM